uniref:Uncharacterized protein n=1 Tax=Anopheles melas TaxID=34690 RepID=A0A182UJK2_9DIPT
MDSANPAPICMFYFAHPFGITSPASGAKLAQIRASATQGCKPNGPSAEHDAAATINAPNGEQKQQRKSNGKVTANGARHPSKSHRKINGLQGSDGAVDGGGTKANHTSHREGAPRKHHRKHRTHRRISNFEKFLLEIQHAHTCGRGSSKERRIDREDRLTPLVPWPSTIWNREFLLPTLLQALAQQHAKPSTLSLLTAADEACSVVRSTKSELVFDPDRAQPQATEPGPDATSK